MLNYPQLEELFLEIKKFSESESPSLYYNLAKLAKIKKLKITYDNLKEPLLDSILYSCPHLENLDVKFPSEWESFVEAIAQRCNSLEHLTIRSFHQGIGLDKNSDFEEYNNLKFLSRKFKFVNNLTSLTLSNFSFKDTDSIYLKNYINLKNKILESICRIW